MSEQVTGATPKAASFDALAGVFDDQRSLPPDALSALCHVFVHAAPDRSLRIVEPGAGTGRIAMPALAAGHHVTAVDVSRPMLDTFAIRLESLPELAARATLVVGDATALPLADDSFEMGLLTQVLYLIPEWERALDELFRVVRPSGEVILVQERSTMSQALRDRDAAWRDAVESVGYRHLPQQPDDAGAVAALNKRAEHVTEQPVTSWPFGQTARDADSSLSRLRPLYQTLDDAAWEGGVGRFLQWQRTHPVDPETWLGGTVELVLARGTVPRDQR